MKKSEKQNAPSMTALATMLFVAGVFMACSMRPAANVGITDAEITSGVDVRLAEESRLAPYEIAVRTDDGVVRLSGNVATADDRDSAEAIAAASRGVVSVDNYIQFGRVQAGTQ
jgi:hyperosmotically inducible protein